jgi:hypothetical protein
MTRLIWVAVAAYVAAVAALVLLTTGPSQLLEPVPWYQMMVFWLMPEASAERIIALAAAGRETEGLLYALVLGLSFGLLGGLALLGAGMALASKARRRLLPVREAVLFLCLLAALASNADPVAKLLRILEAQELLAPLGINAMPGVWIAIVVVSCGVFARYAALMAHDIAAWAQVVWPRLARLMRGWRARPPARAIPVDLPIGFAPPVTPRPSWAAPQRYNPRSAPR